MPKAAEVTAPARGRRLAWALAGLVAVLAAAGIGLFVMYARGGGPVPAAFSFLSPKAPDLLGPSSPAETVLRTLRIAGYDHAVVGERAGTVVVRLDIPQVIAPADVEGSWQTALAAGAAAYPRAGTVVAQLFRGDVPLLEVSADADTVRDLAQRSDGAGLRRAAHVRYLPSSSGGAQ